MPAPREVYLSTCIDLNCRHNSALEQLLPDQEHNASGLQCIDLSRNLIGPVGFKALLPTLKHLPGLTVLNVAYNELNNDSVAAMVDAIGSHPSLAVIDLTGNPVSQSAGKQLLRLAVRSQALTTIVVADTLINPALQKRIASAVESHSSSTASGGMNAMASEPSGLEPVQPAAAQPSCEDQSATIELDPLPPRDQLPAARRAEGDHDVDAATRDARANVDPLTHADPVNTRSEDEPGTKRRSRGAKPKYHAGQALALLAGLCDEQAPAVIAVTRTGEERRERHLHRQQQRASRREERAPRSAEVKQKKTRCRDDACTGEYDDDHYYQQYLQMYEEQQWESTQEQLRQQEQQRLPDDEDGEGCEGLFD